MKFSFLLSEKIIFPVCIAALMFWHFYSLLDYPMYFPDDAMVGSRIKSMLENGNSMGTMELAAYSEVKDIEKVFSKTTYFLSTFVPLIFGEITLFTVRVTNLFYIFVLLCLVFYVSKEIKDWRLGVLSIFILGCSNFFAYGTHIARLDIVSSIFGLASILIFLKNKNNNLILDFVTGAILILALNFHLRIVLYVPIVAVLYLYRYGFKAVTSKNAWIYAFGVVITGGAYYLINVMPYQAQHQALLKMTVGSSRSMPLLSLDYQQFGVCLKEIYLILKKESLIFLAVFVELVIGLIFYRKAFLTCLLLATLFFTPAIMRDFYDFNAIIVLPILCIGSASFFHRLMFNKVLSCLVIIFLLNFGYSSVSKMNQAMSIGCNLEFENNAKKIRNIVSEKDVLMGVDSFWFFFQEHKYHSWLVLKFLTRYHNWSLEQAFKYVKPDYFIADGRFFYFARKTMGPTDWYNSYRIDFNELDGVLKKYSQVVFKQENTCNRDLVVYKFNWEVDGS